MNLIRQTLILSLCVGLSACSDADEAPQTPAEQDCFYCGGDPDPVDDNMVKDLNNAKDPGDKDPKAAAFIYWSGQLDRASLTGRIAYLSVTDFNTFKPDCAITYALTEVVEEVELCPGCEFGLSFTLSEVTETLEPERCAAGAEKTGMRLSLAHGEASEKGNTLYQRVDAQWVSMGSAALKDGVWEISLLTTAK